MAQGRTGDPTSPDVAGFAAERAHPRTLRVGQAGIRYRLVRGSVTGGREPRTMPRPRWWARCRLCGWRTWDHDREHVEHDWSEHYLDRHYEET